MALIPIIIGGALLVGGGLAVTHSNKRQPLPADLRAQVIAAFQSRDQTTIGRVLEAIKTGANGKFKGQAETLAGAIQLGLDTLKRVQQKKDFPEDVAALWWAAISSGDPKTMRTTSEGLRAKYNALASALLDCARILGG
jgi:hypothetical protein